MSAAELLPWLNLLILPGLGYIIRMERRIFALEIMIGNALHINFRDTPKLDKGGL